MQESLFWTPNEVARLYILDLDWPLRVSVLSDLVIGQSTVIIMQPEDKWQICDVSSLICTGSVQCWFRIYYSLPPPSVQREGILTNRFLSRYSCSAKVRSNTSGKNRPTLVSAPIFRVTDQSKVKCHHFENCNFNKDLYGEWASLAHSAHLPYKIFY